MHAGNAANLKPIEWYITPNVPVRYMSIVRDGVEGWNRYSQKMWKRDLVKFMGVMPFHVKIGDPRFNIINWDSVPDATAAYESAAADPLTGIQSHALIYLPFSWVRIGKEYWANHQMTQKIKPPLDPVAIQQKLFDQSRFLGHKLDVQCLQDTAMVASLAARRSPDAFANDLLKQVLFHEVGHALGLAHNFKGSLSLDIHNPQSSFSSSIMDYNQYQLEGEVFPNSNTGEGPLLEYDRQILSVLYNSGADVRPTDPVVPTCNDHEADGVEGGVDPFCIRYDAGQDPSEVLLHTIELVKDRNATLINAVSLPVALAETSDVLRDPQIVASESEARKKMHEYAEQLTGTANYYFAAGAQSLGNMTKFNLRMLHVFLDDQLPGGFSPIDVRKRAVTGLEYVAALDHLEPTVQSALHDADSLSHSVVTSDRVFCDTHTI